MPPEDVVDLRSDFLAHPTEAMLDAYRASAKGGAYGLREDAQQRKLEAKIARLLGCEDALIFPTCTMANLTAVLLHTSPGDVVVTQAKAHVVTSEAGGAVAIGGVQLQAVPGESVEAPVDEWLLHSNAALFWIENTHNRLGGAAASADYCSGLAANLRGQGPVKLHLDGSRILYAAAVFGVAPSTLAKPFDTVSISLNKGLAAPIPAALAGPRETIERAEHIRQRLGGGIRPVAAGCAATIEALEDVGHLRDDLRRAKRFAERLAGVSHLTLLPVVSNLVFFDVDESVVAATELVARCAAHGILINSPARGRIRAVFYRGVSDDDVERAATIVERALEQKELMH